MYTVLKGTHDVINEEANRYSYIEEVLIKVATLYGYKEFRTPIIENSELFTRSVGEGSDIVRKEMYTFYDKGDRLITLRPEMTAGCVRSKVNNKLFANQDFPVKAFYVGPNFRYERPQQGRYRQFNQFGIECCGVDNSYRDIEVIALGYNALKLLGFSNLKLKINSLGDKESRERYHEALKEYFSKYVGEMCEDCKERFEKNILRILDCKDKHDQEIIANAPKISDYYTEEAENAFKKVLEELQTLGIEYEIDHNLVRGLDYYTGVVFEYHYTSQLGKNYGALGGGGHYANLIKEVGGPDLEGVGVAFGIERLANVMSDDDLFEEDIDQKLDVYIMPLSEVTYKEANVLANFLRLNGYATDACFENKGFKQMFKKAERRGAKFAIIIGEDEVKNDVVVLKNLETTEQKTVANEDILETIDELFELDAHEHEHSHCDCDHE